ncbi:MAG: polyphosphate:AMP phosphotransferase [Pseudomonadota bacterium]
MFEVAELGRKLSKSDYKAQIPELREQLLDAQFSLSGENRSLLIIISGLDAAGRGEVVSMLNEWLDARGIETVTFEHITDEEAARPEYWRYWRNLPAKGRIHILFGGWYISPVTDYAYKRVEDASFDQTMTHIRRFEHMLAADGMVILKFWLHISEDIQQNRLETLSEDPHSKRRVSKRDWRNAKRYKHFVAAAEHMIRQTSTGDAPWILVEASNQRYRDIAVARHVLRTLQKLDNPALPENEQPVEPAHPLGETSRTVLDTVDLTQTLSKVQYKDELKVLQGQFNKLSWAAHEKKRSLITVFEGWDAAGKGGAIRRLTQAMDARLYRVISIAAPTDEERAHHYLWRFWRHIPRDGMFTIYDRSWYGRVLVERVEGFAEKNEWMRAYMEINEFENMLVEHGTMLCKFWLHISPEEQLRRFKEREDTPHKRHKITEEDWRNREKWDDYALAIDDMVARTSNRQTPWHLIPAEDKRYARIAVLRTVCETLEAKL